MKPSGSSVPAEALIALYGQPKQSPLRKRARGAKLASSVALSPSKDDVNELTLPRCSSAPAANGRNAASAIMLLGPRATSSMLNTMDSCSPPSHASFSMPPSTAPAPKSDHRNFSIAELKRIVHKAKPTQDNSNFQSPSDLAVTDAIPDPPPKYCSACAGGFCISNAFPHGPDGYTDYGRRRDGPRPCSPPVSPNVLAVTADGTLRPNTAGTLDTRKGKTQRTRTSSARASSMEKWSNDGSCSYDAFDYVEMDPDDAFGKSPVLGGTWVNRPHKHDTKCRNPFVEFETHEQRLIQERQWLLEEDGNYMHEKKKDLKHNKVQNRMDLGWHSPLALYECRMLYGPYSMDMKEQKYGKQKLIKPKNDKSAGMRKRNSSNKRGDVVEVYADPSNMEIKGCQKRLEASMQQCGYQSEETLRKEAKIRSDTLDVFRQAFQVSSGGPEIARSITREA